MISMRDYFGSWYGSPLITPTLQSNAMRLLSANNKLELMMLEDGIRMPINPKTKSQISGDTLGGFRPLDTGVGAGNGSSHCEASGVDRYDPTIEVVINDFVPVYPATTNPLDVPNLIVGVPAHTMLSIVSVNFLHQVGNEDAAAIEVNPDADTLLNCTARNTCSNITASPALVAAGIAKPLPVGLNAATSTPSTSTPTAPTLGLNFNCDDMMSYPFMLVR